jgi:peptidyl-tRNA hydrolase
MSLSYVSNSDTLRFVQTIGGDLDLLFLALWRHVLCIEFIRLRYGVSNEEKSRNTFQRLLDRFTKDQRKQKSLHYLREWQGKFWITMDQNIREITERYEDKLQA